MLSVVGSAACLLASAPVSADNCNGRFSNVAISAEVLEVGKGHTVTYFVARGSATSDNSAHNGVGECGGYALATPDGKVRMAGVCARKDKDGNSWSDEWGLDAGAEKGWWRMSGGARSPARRTRVGGSPSPKMARPRWGTGGAPASSAGYSRIASMLDLGLTVRTQWLRPVAPNPFLSSAALST